MDLFADAKLKEHMSTIMRVIKPADPRDPGFAMTIGRPHYRLGVDPHRIQIPGIVRIIFELIDLQDLGHAEKLAWEYAFEVDGIACSLAHQKFGLRLYVDSAAMPSGDDASALLERITKSLESAQRSLEKRQLRQFADEQIRQGRLTIRNQYRRLRSIYEYFQEGATLAFAGQGRLNPQLPGGGRQFNPHATEGFYNTVAMVTAYFSLLEHTLVLLLPFRDFNPSESALKDFIGDRWGDKFRNVFTVDADPSAKKHFDALYRIAEEYRNTYGHGGFDRHGSSFLFHMQDIGALPAVLSDIRGTPYFSFVPIDADDFSRVKLSFDSIDEWLTKEAAPLAMKWIESGLDVYYDENFRTQATLAAESPDHFESFIEYFSYLTDQAANMDW
ncbi:hypothetical protein OG758_22685 [Streptomyces sp. NBC_01474]|uniref:hypothetical protein n=1 Tax=Streptomyces sp. NBC_01474 TaxID=2903880 RepID=UPI002DD8F589|nr:hypothetical protein [Streptomyces sp. NBC_01474]WSD96711.1 hypothetical protein OG758_22685 [Streptomyces sp. NBC_01474]